MLTRIFNVGCGISRKDDTWPQRFFNIPISEGPRKGKILKKEDFNKMLDEYYKIKGWDINGIPTNKRLSEIGISKTKFLK
jgi:aldehyde:ferredoxin oxidoreductase